MTNYNRITVNELILTTINHRDIYHSTIKPTIRRLAKKMVKGTYDHDKALKVFYNIAIEGARSYHDIHGSWGSKWYQIFTVADRKQAAKEMLAYYMDEIEGE